MIWEIIEPKVPRMLFDLPDRRIAMIVERTEVLKDLFDPLFADVVLFLWRLGHLLEPM